ncbi:MAG: triose-phosphate isomerase [Deltaproteobacteria bacterium]|nr:triose-phosphate isomerase [Deltaproteobacteria bacterium]
MTRRRLIVGNWKMNGTVTESLKIVTALEHQFKTPPDADVVVAPPFTVLYSVGVAIQDLPFQLGAQNCHWEDKGAFTGEVAAAFLCDIGCRYVIVGHSERRQYCGETDEMVNKKIATALRHELQPIICVGETAGEREANRTWEVLDRQLKGALVDLHHREMEQCVVAYEPVWAIGSGTPATPEMAIEVHHYIRNQIAKRFDAPTAAQVRIIYGGSVKGSNVAQFSRHPEIDGCLVGGASLEAVEFAEIVRTMERGVRSREEGN